MRDIYDDRVLDSCARFSGSGAAKTAKTVLSFNICSCCCLLPHGSGVRSDLVPFQISVDPTLLVACCVRGQPLLFAWHPVSPVAWSGQVWSHVGFRWIHVSVNMRPLSEFDARRGPVPDLRVLQEFEDVKRGDLANLAGVQTKLSIISLSVQRSYSLFVRIDGLIHLQFGRRQCEVSDTYGINGVVPPSVLSAAVQRPQYRKDPSHPKKQQRA